MSQPQLQLPIPDNMRGKGFQHVTSDVFNVCERIKEISPRLRVLHQPRRSDAPWVVFEDCADGVERFVARYSALDARIIEDLQRMLRIPASQRIMEAERKVEEHNKKMQEFDPENESFDRMVHGLHKALVESNLSSGTHKSTRKNTKRHRAGR